VRTRVGLLLLGLSSSSVAFDGQPLQYEIDWGPVTLADATVELLDSGDIRSVSANVSSRGVGAWFSDFQSTLEIMRTSDGTQILNGRSTWDDALSNITVMWLPTEPKPSVDYYRSKLRDYEITPVPDESIADTVDPFTPIFDIGRRLDETERCEGSYRIFDGIRRYDLEIQDGGLVTLTSDDPVNFNGPARRCDITLTRIGGFSTKKGLFKFGESEISRILYLGEIRGHWVPVRFEVSVPLGSAVARLIDVNRTVASQ
jgi:hypothetical protein